jgi:hypothetical protein
MHRLPKVSWVVFAALVVMPLSLLAGEDSKGATQPQSAADSKQSGAGGSAVQGKGSGSGKSYRSNTRTQDQDQEGHRYGGGQTGSAQSSAAPATSDTATGRSSEGQAPEPALNESDVRFRKARDGSGFRAGNPQE